MASLQEPDSGITTEIRSPETESSNYFVPPHSFIPSRSLVERLRPAFVIRDTFSTSTNSATNPGNTCPADSTDPICAKPVSQNTFTLPIALGVTIPIVGALIAFFFLHRRHKRKLREEDADVRNASLDFGLGNSPPRNSRRPINMDDEFDMKEKPHTRGRGLSMDLSNPYLLPPELVNSRESLRSLSRNIHNAEDPYRPVSELIADAQSPRYNHRDGGSSIYTGSSGTPSRLHERLHDSSTADLLSNARLMSRSPVPRTHSPLHPQKSLVPIDTRQPHLSTSSSPNSVSPIEPAYTRDQSSSVTRKGGQPQTQSLAPRVSNKGVRDSYVSDEDKAIRMSNNYLGRYIHGRDPVLANQSQPSARTQSPPPVEVQAPTPRGPSPLPPLPPPPPQAAPEPVVQEPIVRKSPPISKSLPATPRPPRKDSVPINQIQIVEPEPPRANPEPKKLNPEQQVVDHEHPKLDYEHQRIDNDRQQVFYDHRQVGYDSQQADQTNQQVKYSQQQVNYEEKQVDYKPKQSDYSREQVDYEQKQVDHEHQRIESQHVPREYGHQQTESRHVPREYGHDQMEPVHQQPQPGQDDWYDETSDYRDDFHGTPPPAPPVRDNRVDNGDHNSRNDRHSRRYSMDVPPEEFANAGLGAPGFDARRISLTFRPLPPSAAVESDDPELRANRIRSFYKEYFDESKPAPRGQYYEDYDSGYYGAAYQDPQYYNDYNYNYQHQPMPYAQPMARRAMTPPPGSGRYMGQVPRAFHGSMTHMNGRPMVSHDERPYSSHSGLMPPQHERPYSTMSGFGAPAIPPRGRPRPPPQALNSLPTPSKLKDDSFAIMNAIDFAPPASYRERAQGRSQSPLGERRPYSPSVPAFKPLSSAYEELPTMPSPHHLPKSGTFTGLDFAPPRKIFRGEDSMSDAGSIRSNTSAASARQVRAIRSGAYRVSRLPGDQVFAAADISTVLKPTWDQRAATPSFA